MFDERPLHTGDKIRVPELDRTHVDRHHKMLLRRAITVPPRELSARSVDNPGADLDDLSGLLGDADKVAGQDQSALRVAPAQQGLGADNPAAIQYLGLVVELELLAGQCRAQAQLDGKAGIRRAFQLGPIERYGAAAILFGLVHGGIGAVQQFGGVVPIGGEQGHADADGQVILVVGDLVIPRQPLQQPVGRAPDFVVGGLMQYHHELVAAEAGDGVLFPGQLPQPRGHFEQDLIAGAVAQAVVDALEMIQVDEQQCATGAGAFGCGNRLAHPVEQQTAVGEPGQGIEKGELLDGLLGRLALGDIRYRAAHHDQIAKGVVFAFRLGMGPAQVAQPILDAHVEFKALAAQGLRQGIVDQRHVVGMDDAGQCRDAVRQCARRQSEEILGVIGPAHDPGGGVVLPAGDAIGAIGQADQALAGCQFLDQPLALLLSP